MPLVPQAFTASGQVVLLDESAGHTSTVPISAFVPPRDPLTDQEQPNYLAITCPYGGCANRTLIGITGGARRELEQLIFLRRLYLQGGRTLAQCRTLLEERIAALGAADLSRLDAIRTVLDLSGVRTLDDVRERRQGVRIARELAEGVLEFLPTDMLAQPASWPLNVASFSLARKRRLRANLEKLSEEQRYALLTQRPDLTALLADDVVEAVAAAPSHRATQQPARKRRGHA